MTSKEYIKKRLLSGINQNYSHMIMVCDTFDYEDYAVFVSKNESIDTYIKKYDNPSKMSKIMEIYHYDMDLDYQLNEQRAYHKEAVKIPRPKTIVDYAEAFATTKHAGQKRKNGNDYISHPTSVAQLLCQYKKSHNLEKLTAAAYLHDVLEDTDTTYYELVDRFGYEIASLVMEVTTNEEMKNAIGKEKYLAYKLNHMTKWALVIKLCDRLDNILDLDQMSEEFRNRYLHETTYIIDYICTHRQLSKTHRTIIQSIMENLKKLEDKFRLAKS